VDWATLRATAVDLPAGATRPDPARPFAHLSDAELHELLAQFERRREEHRRRREERRRQMTATLERLLAL
jgi:hypothetical protein